MNWKNEAVNDLSTDTRRKESLVNIKQSIEGINMQRTFIRSTASDFGSVMGGVSHYEDRILDNIVKWDRLVLTYRATSEIVKLIEKGLIGLDEREWLVLRHHGVACINTGRKFTGLSGMSNIMTRQLIEFTLCKINFVNSLTFTIIRTII